MVLFAGPNRIIVLNGPSGSGKSTLFKSVTERPCFRGHFGFSVSHTTRAPRKGEQDGVDYHYVTREQFLALQAEGGFLETAETFTNLYGTSYEAINDVLQRRHCILDIDYKGSIQLKQLLSKEVGVHALFVFISPPSRAILEQRLRGRKTESEEQLALRLATAVEELTFFETHPDFYDVHIVNNDLETASTELEHAIRKFLCQKFTPSMC